MMGYVKIVVCLVSRLSAHFTSQNHNSTNLRPILEIKLSKAKLSFYGTDFESTKLSHIGSSGLTFYTGLTQLSLYI